MLNKKKVILLGATGSIGTSTCKVLRSFPENFKLVGISAHSKSKKLLEIAEEFNVKNLAITSNKEYLKAKSSILVNSEIKYFGGSLALEELIACTDADLVVVATLGSYALMATLNAIEKGMDIALANKELLVLGGDFITKSIKKHNVRLLPIDSEHNAVFQCIQGYNIKELKSISLTASGGACRNFAIESLGSVTPSQAQNHPNWSMGTKITIDSATMANKGLELIEAKWLFGLKPEQLKVIIHPESKIHSFVEWIDGSILAQLSPPDMTFAIQHCLFYPQRKNNPKPSINFNEAINLTFHPPDLKRYPCLEIAYEVLKMESFASVIYNASNEIAVQRFIKNEIKFTDIPKVIINALEIINPSKDSTLKALIELDMLTREHALKSKIT